MSAETDGATPAGTVAEPLFRVVRGTPTEVELAALSVVLAVRIRPQEESSAPPTGVSAWAASARRWQTAGRPGPDAWRRSARA